MDVRNKAGIVDCSIFPLRNANLGALIFMRKKSKVKQNNNEHEIPDNYLSLPIVEYAKKALPNSPYRNKYRDYAILMLASNAGLFPKQIVSLKMDQLSVDRSTGEGLLLNVIGTRRSMTSYDLPLLKDVIEALQLYFEKERGIMKGYIFHTQDGKKINKSTITKIFHNIRTRYRSDTNSDRVPFLNINMMRKELRRKLLLSNYDEAEIARRLGCYGYQCFRKIG